MTKNTENIIKIDINSSVDMCQKIETLTAENEQLKDENETLFETNEDLIKEIRDLKSRCFALSEENINLSSEIRDMKFTRQYLTSDEAGRKFAQDLLGLNKADFEEEKMIADGEAHYERFAFLGDDF